MRYTVTRVGSSGGLQAPGTQPFPPAGYFFPPSSPSKLSVVFSLRQGSHPTLPFHRASFSLHFGRHYRYLVSCLTAGAKRCVGFGPPFLFSLQFLGAALYSPDGPFSRVSTDAQPRLLQQRLAPCASLRLLEIPIGLVVWMLCRSVSTVSS